MILGFPWWQLIAAGFLAACGWTAWTLAWNALGLIGGMLKR